MKEKLNILQNALGSYYKSHDEFLFTCPFCKHHKRKLSVNLNLNVFKCWICDTRGKDLSYLIKRFASRPDKAKWFELNNTIDMSATVDFFSQQDEPEHEQIITLPEEFVFLGNRSLPFESAKALKYLSSRGLAREEILYYKLGFCHEGEYKNRIIIPSFNRDGYCNYFVGRSYTDDWMKYKNPRTSKDVVFNELLIDWSRPVILVEGPFDSLKAKNSIPVLGSTLNTKSRLFLKLIEKQVPVYIGFDHDALQKSLLVIKNMIEYGLEVYKMDTSKIEDIGALTGDEVEKMKQESALMDFENFIISSCF